MSLLAQKVTITLNLPPQNVLEAIGGMHPSTISFEAEFTGGDAFEAGKEAKTNLDSFMNGMMEAIDEKDNT